MFLDCNKQRKLLMLYILSLGQYWLRYNFQNSNSQQVIMYTLSFGHALLAYITTDQKYQFLCLQWGRLRPVCCSKYYSYSRVIVLFPVILAWPISVRYYVVYATFFNLWYYDIFSWVEPNIYYHVAYENVNAQMINSIKKKPSAKFWFENMGWSAPGSDCFYNVKTFL